MLKNGKITIKQIQSSKHFHKVEDRFNNIYKLQDICCDRLVFDFDNNLANSKIIADILLYTRDEPSQLHLFIKRSNVKDTSNSYVPVTFFVNYSENFILNQKQLTIVDFKIVPKSKKSKSFLKPLHYL